MLWNQMLLIHIWITCKHSINQKNTESTPAIKTLPVTSNTKSHDEDTIKTFTARIYMIEKWVLQLQAVLQVTTSDNSHLKEEADILQYKLCTCVIVDGITLVKNEIDE